MRIERIRDVNQLSDSVRAQWNQLPMPSPMQSAEWLIHWWQAFGQASRDQLNVLLVFDDEQLIAAAPWYVSRAWTGSACLRFLGDGTACSDHATILIQDGHRQSVLELLTRWLLHEASTTWHAIDFESVAQDDPAVSRLVRRLGEGGCERHLRDTVGTWVVELPATWDEFLASLSKNCRKRCRRWQRTYFDSARAEVVHSTCDSLADAWQDLARLNQDRRRDFGDRSAFDDAGFDRFHRATLPSLFADGRAEIRRLRIDGQLKAAEYVLFRQGTVFCYQSGMTTSEGRDGYGNLSILALVRDAIDQGFTRLDFLRGDEDYKQHWGAHRVACVSYHVASPTLQGAAHLAYHRVADHMRRMKRSLVGANN